MVASRSGHFAVRRMGLSIGDCVVHLPLTGSCPDPKYYRCICLEGLGKTAKALSKQAMSLPTYGPGASRIQVLTAAARIDSLVEPSLRSCKLLS